MEWPQLRGEIGTVAAAVAGELRALPADRRLARIDWTAAELGAHLVSLPPRYRRMQHAPVPVPASLAAENRHELDAVAERDPTALADQLGAEVAALLDALGADGDRPVRYFTAAHTASGLGGIMLAELLVHGWDLARANDRRWPISRTRAAAALRGIVPVLPLFADPAIAATAAGTYHLRLRGDSDWTFEVRDSAVTVRTGRPRRADLRLSADPSVFLRNAYGVVGDLRAALTGGVVVSGRRPWLARRFGRLFTET